MKAVFHGSLNHDLTDTLRSKVKTPWILERFLEKDPRPALARGASLIHQLK